ncbi:MAG: hypothetical protein CMJ62_02610 [Planctomycetaceae bacterium]|nr:hypothetical protein [Planctomycetaceae bacterium]
MRTKVKAAITSLKSRARDFRQKQPPSQPDLTANVVIGCFHILRTCPTHDLQAWLARKPNRAGLKDASTVGRTKQGIQAVRELIALTISDLEARTWLKEIEVGPLPVKESRKASEKQREALQAGRRKRNTENTLIQKDNQYSVSLDSSPKTCQKPGENGPQFASFAIL